MRMKRGEKATLKTKKKNKKTASSTAWPLADPRRANQKKNEHTRAHAAFSVVPAHALTLMQWACHIEKLN